MGKGKKGSTGKRPWSRVIDEGQNETEHLWEGQLGAEQCSLWWIETNLNSEMRLHEDPAPGSFFQCGHIFHTPLKAGILKGSKHHLPPSI